jgi:stage V sporulation protein D (sporulation-specific penicillin-binding protein)
LGISPNAGEQTTVTVPSYNGKSVEEAKSSVEETLGVKCIVRGDGDIVVTQLPANGTVISDNGVVILYTDGAEIEANATVPNVIGMSPSKAIKTIVDSNLNVSVKGIFNGDYNNCKANAQSIPSGTQVLPGTVIEIEFLYDEEIE